MQHHFLYQLSSSNRLLCRAGPVEKSAFVKLIHQKCRDLSGWISTLSLSIALILLQAKMFMATHMMMLQLGTLWKLGECAH